MVEYFAGTDDDATRYLLHAFELAPQPKTHCNLWQTSRWIAPRRPILRLSPSCANIPTITPKMAACSTTAVLCPFAGTTLLVTNRALTRFLKRLHTAESLLPKDASHIVNWESVSMAGAMARGLANPKSARIGSASADAHYRLARFISTWDNQPRVKRKGSFSKSRQPRSPMKMPAVKLH